MTKEEFVGFSSAAQHDMVLEALVRVTKNLETMEKENGKPFVGTTKQRRNDVKLLTILAEAFSKNELVWDYDRMYKNGNISESNYKTRCGECMARGYALYTGIGQNVYIRKSLNNSLGTLFQISRHLLTIVKGLGMYLVK